MVVVSNPYSCNMGSVGRERPYLIQEYRNASYY
ncbi:hypothetical protein VPHD479_0323 [Vibrio phage D479]